MMKQNSKFEQMSEISEEFQEDLNYWNDEKVAFIKRDVFEGKNMWLIYGADGLKIAATDDRDFAFVVARQNDLTPCSVHLEGLRVYKKPGFLLIRVFYCFRRFSPDYSVKRIYLRRSQSAVIFCKSIHL